MGSPRAAAAGLFQLTLILKALLSDVRGIRKTCKNGKMQRECQGTHEDRSELIKLWKAMTWSNRLLMLLTRDSI
jgi:hypothetical protein